MKHQPNRRDPQMMKVISKIAERQGGIIHRSQLLDAGLSADSILDWIDAGWLDARFRWTVALPGTPKTLPSTCWSAVLSAGGDSALTATHALALMELADARRNPLVLRSDGRPRRQAGMTVRQVPVLPDGETTDTFGPRTTTFARAVLDAAGLPWWTDLDRTLDRAVRLGHFDATALAGIVDDHRNARGRPHLESALARLDANAGLKRSELERRLAELIATTDLPTPVINSMLEGYEVDFFWLGTRAIIETDGRKDHISPGDVARDLAKRSALRDAGYELLLLDWWSVVYRPDHTLDRIRAFLAANQAPPVRRATR
jgi:very-short-patch-repair endonuclease